MANVGDGPRAAFAKVQTEALNWRGLLATLRYGGWDIGETTNGEELGQEILELYNWSNDDSRFPADWPPMDDLDDHNFEPGDHR